MLELRQGSFPKTDDLTPQLDACVKLHETHREHIALGRWFWVLGARITGGFMGRPLKERKNDS
jgi:hypothetical protein